MIQPHTMLFADRRAAGKQLAAALQRYTKQPNTYILGLPRGGVVVAAVIAQALQLPLDIVVPRKLGAPGNPEFAIGAITESGEAILNQAVIHEYGVPETYLQKVIQEEQQEAQRRLTTYRAGRPPLSLHGATAILVDDGLATGYTMQAAIAAVRAKAAKRIIVALPVAPPDSIASLQQQVDEVVVLDTPEWFNAIGQFYEQFDQVTDAEVIQLLSSVQVKLPAG